MLNITKLEHDGTIFFSLEGRLDTNTSSMLENEMDAFLEHGSSLELDFGGLTYISSMGLRVLLGTQKKINRKGGNMLIRGVSPTIREVFDVTGFSGFLSIV